MKIVGIKTDVLLTRTLYIEVEDNITEEQIKEIAQKEITLPVNALYTASNLLKKVGINQTGLDLKDWDVKNIEYNIL